MKRTLAFLSLVTLILGACGPVGIPATVPFGTPPMDGAGPTATPTNVPFPTATQPPTATATAQTPTPDLTVQKTTQCSSSYTCVFTITVTNQGPGPYTGPLTVSDQTTPSWSTLLSGGGSISGALCSGPSPNVVCQAPSVTLAPGQSYSFSFGVYFGPTGYSQPFQNCASLPPNTDSNPANNQACINISPPGSMPSLMPTLIPASSFPPASSRLLA